MKSLILLIVSVLKVYSHPLLDHSDRIVNGENADTFDTTFVISIQYYPLTKAVGQPIHTCGGTLITESWILTAAHCLEDLPVKDTVILAGAKDLGRINNGVVQHRDVEQTVAHPKYKGGATPFDLGMIRVTRPFDIGYFVRPIKLPDANKIYSGMTRVYGWGEDLDPNQFNDILQTATLPIVNYDQCIALADSPKLHPTNMCTGVLAGRSSCSGDSGGPVILQNPFEEQVLVGIVSYGFIPCGTPNTASVHVRVSAFIDFISSNVNHHP